MVALSDRGDAEEARRQLLAAFCDHHLDEAARRKGMDSDDDDGVGEAAVADADRPSAQAFRMAALWMPLFNQIVRGVSCGSLDRQELHDRLVVLVGLGLDLEQRAGLRLPVSFALIVAARLQNTPELLTHRTEGGQHWIELTPAGAATLGFSGYFPLDLTPVAGCPFQV